MEYELQPNLLKQKLSASPAMYDARSRLCIESPWKTANDSSHSSSVSNGDSFITIASQLTRSLNEEESNRSSQSHGNLKCLTPDVFDGSWLQPSMTAMHSYNESNHIGDGSFLLPPNKIFLNQPTALSMLDDALTKLNLQEESEFQAANLKLLISEDVASRQCSPSATKLTGQQQHTTSGVVATGKPTWI